MASSAPTAGRQGTRFDVRLPTDLQPNITNQLWLFVATVCTVVRPTSAVFFGPLVAHFVLWRHPWRRWPAVVSRMTLRCVLPTLAAAACVDRACYGRWTLAWWNFVRFNVLEGGSAHFGVNAWYYYLVDGLPLVIGPVHLLMLAHAAIVNRWRPRALLM